jgi:hypothetical protein
VPEDDEVATEATGVLTQSDDNSQRPAFLWLITASPRRIVGGIIAMPA